MEPVEVNKGAPFESKLWVVIDHLSGFYRGSRQILSDDDLEIGSARDATIHFPVDHEPHVALHHARIGHDNGVFELTSIGDAPIRVNGNPVERHMLSSGDLIVVGEHGPVIRFRIYRDPNHRFKSIPEALSDCVDSARVGKRSLPGRLWEFVKHAPNELLRQTAPWTRVVSFGLISFLVLATGYLAVRSFQFQRALESQGEAITMVQEASEFMSVEELESLRSELETSLSTTIERIEALEEMSASGQRIVGEATRSIAFLIGEYGFVDSTGMPLRTVVDERGRMLLSRNGQPLVRPDGNGPPYKAELTGTGFSVHEEGLFLTNRHIVLPWDYSPGDRTIRAGGYRPVMNRFVAYLPGFVEGFPLSLVTVSDSVDLALLICQESHRHVPAMELGNGGTAPGDEVFVMGYPTGIRALLARTDARFVSRLLEETKRDFWTIAERLAEEGHITPLATSGIIGQVTSDYVVYDAQTTHGGSGGPVIGRDGRVVAINAAILNDFGGSNLGIPIRWASEMLDRLVVAE